MSAIESGKLSDSELQGALLDRRRLLEVMAAALRRVGPSAGKTERKRANTYKRLQRLDLRKNLRANADAIAARCMTLFGEE